MNEILKKRIENIPYRITRIGNGANDAYNEGVKYGAEWMLSHMWISVKEALPTRYTFVVTADKYGHLNFAQVDEKGLWFGNSYPVDYWMPIPELKLNCNG